jgi:hypothetical protein
MSAYVKQKSDGAVLHSCSSQTIANPDHLKSCQDFVTSRGMSLSDFIIADADDDVVSGWIKTQDDAAMTYADRRKKSYPPIGDQLDALWKGGDDAAAMKVIIDKVKSDNPK